MLANSVSIPGVSIGPDVCPAFSTVLLTVIIFFPFYLTYR